MCIIQHLQKEFIIIYFLKEIVVKRITLYIHSIYMNTIYYNMYIVFLLYI